MRALVLLLVLQQAPVRPSAPKDGTTVAPAPPAAHRQLRCRDAACVRWLDSLIEARSQQWERDSLRRIDSLRTRRLAELGISFTSYHRPSPR